MKALCIIGSPQEQGSTAAIVGRIAAGLADAGCLITTYRLDAMRIGFCRGCKACAATGQCVQRDDMDLLIGELMAADVIVIGSPSYWGDVTAQLKTFIDRCTPYSDTRPGGTPVPPGKHGIAVAVRAGHSKGENQHIVDTLAHFFGHLGITLETSVTFESIRSTADLVERQEAMEQAYQLGYQLVERSTDADP